MSTRRARLVQGLASRLGAGTVPTPAGNEVEMEVAPADLAAAVRLVQSERGHLLAAYGADERSAGDGGLRVRYVFGLEGEDLLVVLRATLDPDKPIYASLAPLLASAAWPEREIADLFGARIEGHPDPRPLLPGARDRGPLGRESGARGAAPAPPLATASAVTIEGDGVHVLPLGPVQAILGEAADLRLSLFGERLIHLDPRLFRKHRGVERRVEGKDPLQAIALVERVCGGCAVANATAFASAIERLAGCEPPRRGRWIRTALNEIERLCSHAGTLAAILASAGLEAGAALSERAGETVRAAAEAALGRRLLFGTVVPGGVRFSPTAAEAKSLTRAVRDASALLRRLAAAALEQAALESALAGKGVLPAGRVAEWGVVGPAARASGSRRDVRRDHPTEVYDELQFWVPVYGNGDALARFRLHADEAQQSAVLIEEALENLPPGATAATLPALPPRSRSLGVVEGPRGAAVQAVHTDDHGRIDRWHLHGASLSNWPALAAVLPGSLLQDFAAIEASFGLCIACVDR